MGHRFFRALNGSPFHVLTLEYFFKLRANKFFVRGPVDFFPGQHIFLRVQMATIREEWSVAHTAHRSIGERSMACG